MNKNLLLGSALLVAISVYPQAGRQAKPTGMINKQESYLPANQPKESNTAVNAGPVKNMTKPASAAKASGIAALGSATSCTKFSGSANAFGGYQGGHEVLQYNADVNAITFVHRCSPTYTGIANGNTGVLVVKYSANQGSTWDSTVTYASTVNFGRYPAGGLYNPLGNSTLTNAYLVTEGETHPGANWSGSHFSSKKVTIPGNTTPGVDMQWFPNTAPFGTLGKKVDFARYGYTYTKDGFVRFLGAVQNDANGTTNLAYGVRGEAIIKGTFVAGAFVWSYDSLVPATIMRSDGSKQLTDRLAMMAWNDAGNIGYVVIYGARAGSTGVMKGYQPIVYKTTTSGASWSLLPQQDFTTYQFKGLTDRLWGVSTNTNLLVPQFNNGEGCEAAVDVNNNLHIVTTVVGTPSTNNDTLDYQDQFGTEKYTFPYGGNFGFPTIYDFYTTTAGGWNYHIVDSMGTEGPAGTSAGGGFSSNPWAAAAIPIDARIQMAFSPDRKKMFYSWTESDTSLTGKLHWNMFPDIKMRAYDVTIDKVTPRVNVTGGVTTPDNADQSAFMQYMANRTILTNSVSGTHEIPFTITYNNAADGNNPVTHFYLRGSTLSQANFSITPMRPVGVSSLANNTPSYEVIAYPNPANGSTTVSVNLKDAKPFEINVYNTVGALMQTMNFNGQVGNNNVTLDISKLSAGVYFYNVKADNSIITNKLIVE